MKICKDCRRTAPSEACFCESCGSKVVEVEEGNSFHHEPLLKTPFKLFNVLTIAVFVGIASQVLTFAHIELEISSHMIARYFYDAIVSVVIVVPIIWILFGKRAAVRSIFIVLSVAAIWGAIYYKLIGPMISEGVKDNGTTVFRSMRGLLDTGVTLALSFGICAWVANQKKWSCYLGGLALLSVFTVSFLIDKLFFDAIYDTLRVKGLINRAGVDQMEVTIVRYARRIVFRSSFIFLYVFLAQRLQTWYISYFLFDQPSNNEVSVCDVNSSKQ